MEVVTIRTEGLGDSTYVLIHDGTAVVVDPQRDIDRFERVLDDRNAELRFVLETHLHNDYISGGRDLARAAAGELVLPSGAAPAFRHRPAFHREELDGGSLSIRPLHTPGHTPEHMSYVVLIDGIEAAVFSGGSLLVGSAGRTDLLGMDRADTLARLQYGSVHRLARLPGSTELYPTHGSGSFCTASGTGALTSTIDAERKSNPVLAYSDEDSFVEGQLSGLVPYPAYYRHMGPANLMGMPPAPDLDIPRLGVEELGRLMGEITIVDTRPEKAFAAGHIPGSIGIPLRDDFGVWAGWVLPHNAPVALIAQGPEDVEEARRQLTRIGFDDVRGVFFDLSAWPEDLSSYRTATVEDFASAVSSGAQVLDTRAPNEWEKEGIIPDSTTRYVPDIAAGKLSGLTTDRPIWVACGTGYRATIAASFLEKAGHDPLVLVDAGVSDVLSRASADQLV